MPVNESVEFCNTQAFDVVSGSNNNVTISPEDAVTFKVMDEPTVAVDGVLPNEIVWAVLPEPLPRLLPPLEVGAVEKIVPVNSLMVGEDAPAPVRSLRFTSTQFPPSKIGAGVTLVKPTPGSYH